MAEVTQVFEIVNELAKQAYGMTDLTATDATFVSVGNQVLKSDETVDMWHKVLADRIAKTAICVREYAVNDEGIRKEGIDFGIALQRIYIDMTRASKNTTWNSADEEHSDPYRKSSPAVTQGIFSKLATWEHDITIPDRQLTTAFTSAASMGAFLSGLYVEFQNDVTASYEQMADLCRASGIAMFHTSGKSVNLLAKYNASNNATLKAADCLTDRDFLRFASCEINLTVNRFRRMSTLFNPVGRRTFTPKDNCIVTMLDDYASRAAFYLESDTYHKDLVSLPGYTTIPYWQGSGTDYSFANTSAINVKHTTKDGNVTTSLSGIIGMVYDSDAMGATIDHRRIKTVRNDADEYTNYFAKADVGYYNDGHFNGMVFYVADSVQGGSSGE